MAKQGGLGVVRGFADIAGDVGEAVSGRRAWEAARSLTGQGTPEPTATDLQKYGSRADYYRASLPQPYSQSIKNTIGTEGANAPQNAPERIVGGAAEAIPYALFGGSQGVAGNITTQAVAGAAGATAQELVPESYKPAAGVIGSLVGGFGTSGALAVGQKATQKASDVVAGWTKEGQKSIAGARLKAAADNIDEVNATLGAPPADLVPGSPATLGQLTGDKGILSLERGVAAQPHSTADFAAMREQQNTARREALGDIQPAGDAQAVPSYLRGRLAQIDRIYGNVENAAREHADNLAGGIEGTSTPEASGSAMRDQLAQAEQRRRAAERNLWEVVDPGQRLNTGVSPVIDAASSIYGDLSPAASAGMTPAENAIRASIEQFQPVVPFRWLTDLRSLVSTSMRNEIADNGLSPAYRRMVQVRGAIEGVIDNTVQGRLAQEQEALAAGRLAPEQTMGATLKRQADEFSAARAGRSNVEEPPLDINFDQGAADRLAAATQATRTRANELGAGQLPSILRREGAQGPYRLGDALVPGKVFHPGVNGAQDVQAYLQAVGPEGLSEAAATSMRRASFNPDGTVNPRNFARWQDQHQDALRALPPEVAQRFTNAASASQMVADVATQRRTAIDQFQQGQVAKLIGVEAPQDVSRVVGGIFGTQAGVATMRQLVNTVRGDPEALQGLRRAVVDHIYDKFISNTEVGTSGQTQLNANAFQTFVRKNEGILNEVLEPDQVGGLKSIAQDIQRSKRSENAVRIPGGSNTTQDTAAINKASSGKSWLRTALGDATGAGAGALMFGGLEGSAVGIGVAHVLGKAREAGLTKVDDLVKQAMLNPTLARELIAKARPEHPGAGRALGRRLAALSMYVSGGAGQQP